MGFQKTLAAYPYLRWAILNKYNFDLKGINYNSAEKIKIVVGNLIRYTSQLWQKGSFLITENIPNSIGF
jgi:hypothetical protein